MKNESNIRPSLRAGRRIMLLTAFAVAVAPSVSMAGNDGAPRGGVCPGSGSCFSANGTPGCDDAACCQTVCGFDPFCCDTEWDSFCADEANETCVGGNTCFPSCGKQNVECFLGTPEYASRRPVGIMLRNGGSWCTAWIIAAPNILMTNEHCLDFGIAGLTVEFNYECDQCVGGTERTTDAYTVTEIIHENASLDYALIRVSGNPAATWGVASVDDALPSIGQNVYEIHHGEGRVKGYDDGQVTSIDQPGACIGSTSIEIGVDIVATGGASGAPIFSSDNHCVVGICHCGPACAPGWGIPMSAIFPNALPFITNAGGQIAPCGPTCAGADGDINDDGSVNGVDVQAFVTATIGSPTADQVCSGDFSTNGSLGIEDVPGMVAALLAP